MKKRREEEEHEEPIEEPENMKDKYKRIDERL